MPKPSTPSQAQKFAAAAKAAGVNEDESAFAAILKRIAKVKPKPVKEELKKAKKRATKSR